MVHSVSFSLHDRIGGETVTPNNIDLLTAHQFTGEVIKLIQGGLKRSDLGQPTFEVSEGSYKLTVLVSAVAAISLEADMETLRETSDLDRIVPQRAEVVEAWQKRALRPESFRRYTIFDDSNPIHPPLNVDIDSAFRHKTADKWVFVEDYQLGRVFDIGGKNPNIHAQMKTGETIKISATENELAGADYLFMPTLVRFTGLKNTATGEMKDLSLIKAERAPTKIDEAALHALWEAGRKAWSDVENPDAWLDQLRGY